MIELERFKEGTWYPLPPKYPGIKLKIKPLSRKVAYAAHAKSKCLDDGRFSPKSDANLFMWECFCQVVEDWKGLPIPEGETYSRDQILEALFEEIEISNFVLGKAVKGYEEKEKQLEQELKNSKSSQDG